MGQQAWRLTHSTAMTLWVVPHLLWCLHGTPVTVSDLLPTIARPLVAGIAAAAAGTLVQHLAVPIQLSLLRIALAGTAMLAVYVCVLLFVINQKEFYLDLVRGLMRNHVLAGIEETRQQEELSRFGRHKWSLSGAQALNRRGLPPASRSNNGERYLPADHLGSTCSTHPYGYPIRYRTMHRLDNPRRGRFNSFSQPQINTEEARDGQLTQWQACSGSWCSPAWRC